MLISLVLMYPLVGLIGWGSRLSRSGRSPLAPPKCDV